MLFEVLTETSLSCEVRWTFSENQPWVWAQNQAQVTTECKYCASGAEKPRRLLPCGGRWGMSPTRRVPLAPLLLGKSHAWDYAWWSHSCRAEGVRRRIHVFFLQFEKKQSLLFGASWHSWDQKIRGFSSLEMYFLGFFETQMDKTTELILKCPVKQRWNLVCYSSFIYFNPFLDI